MASKNWSTRAWPAGNISFFCHGTTVGTNALLEEKGAKTGLLVTQGFRGIYEVMEQTRGYGPATYDLFFEKPRLLAPPYLTEEIPERIDFHGNVLKPIDVEASRAGRPATQEKRRAVGGRLLSVFVFESRRTSSRSKKFSPQEFPEARLSLSYEVLPQIREFYRLEHDRDQRVHPTGDGELFGPARRAACARWA